MVENTVEGSNVPKFASFRPKAKPQGVNPASNLQHGEQPDTKLRSSSVPNDIIDRGYTRKKERRHAVVAEETKAESSSKRHKSDKQVTQSQHSSKLETREVRAHDVKDTPKLYQVDRKGDPHNLIYGTTHRYSVPEYYRIGAGTVLGLSERFKIDRTEGTIGVVVVGLRFDQQKKREKYIFAHNERKRARTLRFRSDLAPTQEKPDANFIPLIHEGGGRRDRETDESTTLYTDVDRDYRSIEGKARVTSEGRHDDAVYDSASSASDYEKLDLDFITTTSRTKGAELAKKVDDEPQNIQAWLELISHHNKSLRSHVSNSRRITEAERKSSVAIRLSIYEKALEKVNRRTEGYDRLLLGQLETGSEVWELRTLVEKWKTTLQGAPTSVKLWIKYLDFQQTTFKTFTYDNLRDTYVQIVQVIKDVISAPDTDSDDKNELELLLIYVLLRATLFMRESGFIELAFAVWQGLLELNFFMHDNSSDMEKGRLAHVLESFERLWDGEAPRIGEVGAQGRDAPAQGDPHVTSLDKSAESLEAGSDGIETISRWLQLEKQKALRSRQIARTADEVPDNDPYRVVFFSDIKEFLGFMSSKQCRQCLLAAFMAFCQLPQVPLDGPDSPMVSWWTDAFVRTEFLGRDETSLARAFERTTDGEAESKDTSTVFSEESNDPLQHSPFIISFTNFAVSVDTLFSNGKNWPSCISSWKLTYPAGEGPVELAWFQRIMRSLLGAGIGTSAFAEAYLAFEWANFPESVRHTAKRLLKEYPSSLRLYNAYALVEWRLGNVDKAETVFSIALKMLETLKSGDQDDRMLLWNTWVWEVLQTNPQRALRMIISIPNASPSGGGMAKSFDEASSTFQVHPAALLKAKRFLELGLESAISLGSRRLTVHLTSLLTLLIYLSQRHELENALLVYERAFKTLSHRGRKWEVYLELLHQSRARLLYHHAVTSRLYRPALLREELARSIELYPQNTIFMSLYAWNEARFRVNDRVRSTLREFVLNERTETVVGWIFAIWYERKGTLSGGHNVNSIKAIFERAVASKSGKSSPAIWKLYLFFSISHLPKSDTISILHRSLRSCPWAKALYLLAFEHLTHLLPTKELKRIYEVMREKELRIHIDLEDIFERLDLRTDSEPRQT